MITIYRKINLGAKSIKPVSLLKKVERRGKEKRIVSSINRAVPAETMARTTGSQRERLSQIGGLGVQTNFRETSDTTVAECFAA